VLDLKPGDEVAICRRVDLVDMGTVETVGAREVRLKDGSRWNRRNAYRVGSMVMFDAPHIRKATSDDVKAHIEATRVAGLRYRMKCSAKWDDVPLDKLERIAAILDEKAVEA
jgi:hypothetical protein